MTRASLVLLTTLLIAAPAAAQTTVPTNSRVRVSMRDRSKLVGKLAEVRDDTLVVIRDGMFYNPRVRVPRSQMVRVEVSRGKVMSTGNILGGAFVGAAALGLAALTIPGFVDDGCSGDVCSGPSVGKPVFIGLLAGGVVGGFFPVDQWEQVPTPVRLGFGGGPGHARLGVSLSF